MSTPHTPGPWRVTKVNGTSKDWTVVSVATGGFIAAVSHKPYADLIAKAPIAPKLADALRDCLAYCVDRAQFHAGKLGRVHRRC